jgi:hypothetical protein
MRTIGLLLCLVVLCSTESRAQSNAFEHQMVAAAALRPSSIPSPATLSSWPGASAATRFHSRAPGATLMIVGGAALVAGILVGGSGGTLLIIGGIGVGAYGFYLYTR